MCSFGWFSYWSLKVMRMRIPRVKINIINSILIASLLVEVAF